MSNRNRTCLAGVLLLLSSCGDLQPVSLGSDLARTRAGTSAERDAGPVAVDGAAPDAGAHGDDHDEEESDEEHEAEDET